MAERTILVTGGAGFIASHVIIHLVKKYPCYKIINVDKLDYCSSLRNLESIADAPNYHFVHGDILSVDLVSYVLRTHEVDTIMHFAAQTHVDNSFGNSLTFTRNNVLGTHTLLEASRAYGRLQLFLHVSTDEVYGEGSSGEASHEGTMMEPTNPYSASKAAAEHLVKAYARSFHIPTIITRGNNVYGPHQFPEKIIPKFIAQIDRGRKLTLHGTGENTRNYLFVEDVARAFDVILHGGTIGETYNIGGVHERSNLEVARALLELSGLVPEGGDLSAHVEFVEDRPFNDLRYPLDCSKLLALGWTEAVSFEDGLRRTAEWYRLHPSHWGSVESAIVAHPRRGATDTEALRGRVDDA
jgi:UDP-glucose 4,6-dehydratase